jgi:hypothetical protein
MIRPDGTFTMIRPDGTFTNPDGTINRKVRSSGSPTKLYGISDFKISEPSASSDLP